MRNLRLLVIVVLLGLPGALPASAATPGASAAIHSIAACKDVTTVAVVGSSTYLNNRLYARVYYREPTGKDVLLTEVYSASFGPGPFMQGVSLSYPTRAVPEGQLLRIDVQLQRLSGGSYVNEGGLITQLVTAADKNCLDKCNVAVDTLDKAPASGTLTLRSHYGSWFRPDGRLHGATPISAGQKARVVFVGVPCGWTVRAWYYPKTGDKTPRMLPAQYWPNEFQANALNVTNPYTTAFGKGLKATHPLESNDPFVGK